MQRPEARTARGHPRHAVSHIRDPQGAEALDRRLVDLARALRDPESNAHRRFLCVRVYLRAASYTAGNLSTPIAPHPAPGTCREIGRASCRERVCQYV